MQQPAILSSAQQVVNLLSLQRLLPCNQLILLFLNEVKQLVHRSSQQAPLYSSIYLTAKDIFAPAVSHNAKFVILVQTRPSGEVAPQERDYALADSISHIGKYVGVTLLDYMLLSARDYYSFRESMLLGSLKQMRQLTHG